MGVDAGIVFLPRFTTLVGAATFLTAPIDVSQQGGAQFQVWTSAVRVASGSGTFTLYMEESLDCDSWSLGPNPTGLGTAFTVLPNTATLFSYDFRLRWFRLKIVLGGTEPMVCCWAEGLLRGGGGAGMWTPPAVAGAAGAVAGRDGSLVAGGLGSVPYTRAEVDALWSRYRGMTAMGYDPTGTIQAMGGGGSAAAWLLELERQRAEAAWRAAHGGAAPPLPPAAPRWFGGTNLPVTPAPTIQVLPGNP
jgi:hypothetical protein